MNAEEIRRKVKSLLEANNQVAFPYIMDNLEDWINEAIEQACRKQRASDLEVLENRLLMYLKNDINPDAIIELERLLEFFEATPFDTTKRLND